MSHEPAFTSDAEQRLPLAAGEMLKPKSDLSYRVIKQRDFEGADVAQSLVNGAFIQGCIFKQSNLSRCDFEGTHFQECEFYDCDFGNADLRSCWATKCKFSNCNFSDAYIQDCTFVRCALIASTFECALLIECSFEQCAIEKNIFQKGGFTLNTFKDCAFSRFALGDCTFLNQIMVSCKFDHIAINAESVGTCFGIKPDDVEKFDLIYLGESFYKAGDLDEILQILASEYRRRRWGFILAIFELNFGWKPCAIALGEAVTALLLPTRNNGPIRRDDSTFFRMILRQLADEDRLPPFSCIDIIEKIQEATQGNSPNPHLNMVVVETRGLLQMMLIDFEAKASPHLMSGIDRNAVATFKFKSRPHTDLVNILNLAAECSGLTIIRKTSLMRTETGSFIAIVGTTVLTVAALQMLLFLINGCLFQVTEIRARIETLSSTRLPKEVRSRALAPAQDLPRWLLSPMQSLVTCLLKGTLPLDVGSKGYDSTNLESVEIEVETSPESAKANPS